MLLMVNAFKVEEEDQPEGFEEANMENTEVDAVAIKAIMKLRTNDKKFIAITALATTMSKTIAAFVRDMKRNEEF